MTVSDSHTLFWLPPFIALFAILIFFKKEKHMGLPSCYLYLVHHVWLFDPGAVCARSPFRLRLFCFPVLEHCQPASSLVLFRGSITFRPDALLSTLKDTHFFVSSMTRFWWIGYFLSRQDFLLHIHATLLGRSQAKD